MDAVEQSVLAVPPLPIEGERIGVRYLATQQFLPFQVVMVTKKYVTCISPLNPGMRIGFRIGEEGWTWQPWTACPALKMRCPTCRGNGWVRDKKDEAQTLDCGMCLKTGEVERDDPFTPTH